MIISPLGIKNLEDIVLLHAQNLPHTRSTRIGKEYLALLYRALLIHPESGYVYGAFEGRKLIGVVSVCLDMQEMQRHLLKIMLPQGLILVAKAVITGKVSWYEMIVQVVYESKLNRTMMGKYAYITTLFVDRNARRLGVGKKLVQHIFNFQKKQKLFSVYVDTEYNNNNARKFYQALGFMELQKIGTSLLFVFQ